MSCLIENEADVNAGVDGSCRFTLLMLAASSARHVDVVTFLLEHGAIVDVQNKDGDMALHYAFIHNSAEIVHVLLTHGASQLYNSRQLTPLLSASKESENFRQFYFSFQDRCLISKIWSMFTFFSIFY